MHSDQTTQRNTHGTREDSGGSTAEKYTKGCAANRSESTFKHTLCSFIKG